MTSHMTGPNIPPPVPHVHPQMRRMSHWMFVAFLILAIATTVALWRQQDNFNENKHLDENIEVNAEHACQLALQNREIIADVLTSFRDNPATPEEIKTTVREQLARVQQRERELNCNPAP